MADKLQGVVTLNLVIDDLMRVSIKTEQNPDLDSAALAYRLTPAGHPLRTLLSDFNIYDLDAESVKKPVQFAAPGLTEVLFNVYVEMLRLMSAGEDKAVRDKFFEADFREQTCRYHMHDEEHPKCKQQREEGHKASFGMRVVSK